MAQERVRPAPQCPLLRGGWLRAGGARCAFACSRMRVALVDVHWAHPCRFSSLKSWLEATRTFSLQGSSRNGGSPLVGFLGRPRVLLGRLELLGPLGGLLGPSWGPLWPSLLSSTSGGEPRGQPGAAWGLGAPRASLQTAAGARTAEASVSDSKKSLRVSQEALVSDRAYSVRAEVVGAAIIRTLVSIPLPPATRAMLAEVYEYMFLPAVPPDLKERRVTHTQ